MTATKKMKKVGFRLDAQTQRKLASAAKRTGAPQAELIRRALRKHLK